MKNKFHVEVSPVLDVWNVKVLNEDFYINNCLNVGNYGSKGKALLVAERIAETFECNVFAPNEDVFKS